MVTELRLTARCVLSRYIPPCPLTIEQRDEADTQDHYETLHVARTAPDGVIAAAHAALSFEVGSAEKTAADEALAVLSDSGTCGCLPSLPPPHILHGCLSILSRASRAR
jgi:hypothetical protein